jgi:hypothetical protein
LETIMNADLMGLLMLVSMGMADAAQPELERPRNVPTLQIRETAVAARPQTSPARKAEITRRLFWLALSLR